MFKLFLDKDGKPQFDDKGLPLFIQDGATEPAAIDVNAMIDDNRAKKGAADSAKRERDELAAKFKAFEGLDPEGVKRAMDIAKQAEDGKLFDAGKLDELKAKYAGESSQKLANLERALEDAKKAGENAVADKERVIHGLLVENAFSASSFLREKTVLPPEFAYSTLGKNFSVEYQDDKPMVVAKDSKGNPLFSPSNPAAYATPEEAIKLLIEQHPQRDSLLKAPNPNGGSGAQPGGHTGSGMPSSLKNLKTPADKAKFISENGLEAYKALPSE